MQQNVALKVVAWQRHLFRVAWSLKFYSNTWSTWLQACRRQGCRGWHGTHWFLADQLIPSQPGGQIMPTTLLVPPSHLYTLLRPCSLLLLCGIEAGSAPKILPWLHQVDFILWPTHNFSSAVNIPPRKQSNLFYKKAQMELDISGSSVISCILAQK